MAITYTTHDAYPNIKFPKLHKVKYAETADDVLAAYQRSYKDVLVDQWLENNCKKPYYRSPGYLTEKFIEFECDQEALLFALKWGY